MKIDTHLKIKSNGQIFCTHGALGDFTKDIATYIVPMIDNFVVANFNDRFVKIYPEDTSETIYERFLKEMSLR